jgi:hypothetical protein
MTAREVWRRRFVGSALALGCAVASAAAVGWPGTAESAPASPDSASQDFGPYTCLVGFVWREAVANDAVCVTPEVRAQTKQDNALAAARRSPSGGPFGPDTCLQGYVWREAVANDHVCVTPATRSQARNDNLWAPYRRNSVRTTVRPGSSGTTYVVRADRLNVGRAYLGLYRSSTRLRIKGWYLTAKPQTSLPGGLAYYTIPVPPCAGTANAYFRVRDPVSTRWGNRVYVCTAL